ncbi:hypothetical protein CJ030_MR1G001720 [Morella rubra]|uniref:Uncharacterized protein n=1 Tax=Morella rubra TaxID=262757 RepID=A0A6A1WMA3_9ROSI|nr:hypothetical protein CJ030_MR1G001720 [Morella rubra]
MTLADFDHLLYEEYSLYQLFEYQRFLHQLSWIEGFCVDTLVHDFFCALVSVDRAPEVQLETPNVDGRSHSTKCPFTRAQCMLLLGQQTWIDFPLYMFELIMDDAWGIKDNNLPYGVFLTQFLIQQGVAIGDGEDPCVGATVKTALQPLQEQVDKLTKEVQELRDDQEKLRTAFEGECTVTFLCNKAVRGSYEGATSASKRGEDHFDLDYTRHEDKNQESKINPAELYKKNYTNKDGFGPRKEREKFMNGWMPSSVSVI